MNKSLKYLLLGLLILSSLACQRRNMTYGGAEADSKSPKYSHEFNINSQNTQK